MVDSEAKHHILFPINDHPNSGSLDAVLVPNLALQLFLSKYSPSSKLRLALQYIKSTSDPKKEKPEEKKGHSFTSKPLSLSTTPGLLVTMTDHSSLCLFFFPRSLIDSVVVH
jgi:hypothetical protein